MIRLPDDGPRTETCRSVLIFLMCKFYKFYICAVVGIIIEWGTYLPYIILNSLYLPPELKVPFETSRPICYNAVFSLVSVIVSRSTAVENIQDVFLVSERGGRPYGHFISIWTDEVCPGAKWSVIGRLDRKTSVTFNWSADVSSTSEFQRANVTFRWVTFPACIDPLESDLFSFFFFGTC